MTTLQGLEKNATPVGGVSDFNVDIEKHGNDDWFLSFVLATLYSHAPTTRTKGPHVTESVAPNVGTLANIAPRVCAAV